MRSLLPSSLFARVLLTLVLTFGTYTIVSFGALIYYALLPVVQRSTTDLAAFMELSARTMVQLPDDVRDDYRERLLEEYQLWLRPEADPPKGLRRYFFPYVSRLDLALSERLAQPTAVQSNLIGGRRWFWVAVPTPQGLIWAGFPRDRINSRPLEGLFVVSALALLLVFLSAAVLARRVSAPLMSLAHVAEEIANGRTPQALPETGPREVASLVRQFNQTSRQVSELLADRTVLLTGISHDLRTPLTRLRLAVEMLPEGIDDALKHRMEADIEDMNEQIQQVVEVGRTLGAGKREHIEVMTLISEVVGHRPRVIWRPSGSCDQRVNVLALRRIIGNLLENALRYSNGMVEVRIDCRNPSAVIFVLDNGPGIPASEREAVFRPFYRLETSRNRETGGSGLGLAVARQLAVSNDMEIQLNERVGGGTVASVRLPPPLPMHTATPVAVSSSARQRQQDS